MEVRVENNHLNINKIGYQIDLVADLLSSFQFNLSQVLQDIMHGDDYVDK